LATGTGTSQTIGATGADSSCRAAGDHGGGRGCGGVRRSGGDRHRDTVVTQIAQSGTDVVFFAGGTGSAVPFLKQLRARGFKGPVVAGEGLYDRTLPARLGDEGGDLRILCGCRTPTASSFRDAYKDASDKEPDAYSSVAFDTANLILDGIAKGNGSRQKMADYLKTVSYRGIETTYQFTGTGDLVVDAVQLGVYTVNGDNLSIYGTATTH
jgi:branched-chain amino acid transport system substrate-binding protein